jgi:exosome complex component CSL4
MTSTPTMALPSIALPGQPLAPSSSYKPGPGTHLSPSQSSTASTIRASILGPTVTTPVQKGLPTLSIARQASTSQQNQATLLPKEGSVILGRVTRINIREARVQILVINDIPTMEEFTGVIRYFHFGVQVLLTWRVEFMTFVRRRRIGSRYIRVSDPVISFVRKW